VLVPVPVTLEVDALVKVDGMVVVTVVENVSLPVPVTV
jgi:hypothetical protein